MKDDSRVSPPEAKMEAPIQATLAALEDLRRKPRSVRTSAELDALEQEIVQHTDRLAGWLIGLQVQSSLDAPELREEMNQLVKSHPKRWKNQGLEDVTLRPCRGEEVTIRTVYFCRRGARRKKREKGLYPGLVLLGIHDRCTPGLASEISHLSAVLGSLEEARGVLSQRGLELDVKTIRAITYRYAQRARARMEDPRGSVEETVAGKRVVISTDGGRIRIRRDKRGPKTKKGRRRYTTHWREPKLLPIYLVDEEGRRHREFMPFIDGTLKGPDALFMLMEYYLSQLEITQAHTLLVVADGARWIWNRMGKMLRTLGVATDRVYEVVDFYHAVEHLGKVAALRKGWSEAKKRAWVKKHRRLLKQGKVDRVVEAVQELCRGRNSKEMRRERGYFVRNRRRMDYARIAALTLPIGSGAMESAIRRVVNLRLKGPGLFWHESSAEAMLLLRSYYKAGRWNLLKKLALSVPYAEAA